MDRKVSTVKAFAERHRDTGWTEPRVRWAIHNADRNGLERAGAIVRFKPAGPARGRGTVLIDEQKFFAVVLGETV